MTLKRVLTISPVDGGDVEHDPTSDEFQFAKLTLLGLAGIALDVNGKLITGVGNPVNASDAINKAYADQLFQGASSKTSARVVADSNIASRSGLLTIDGTTISAGDDVLLIGQTNPVENGLYTGAVGPWPRAADLPAGAHAAGAYVFIKQGTVYDNAGFLCATNPPNDVVGTDGLAWTQFTGVGAINVGNGLDKNGNTISGKLATNSGLQFTGGGFDHLLAPSGGLTKGAAGLAALLDPNNTLGLSAAGLKALGLPSSFTLSGAAVSANVTAAALSALCDGVTSFADDRHNHAFAAGAQVRQNASQQNGATAGNMADPVYWTATANTLGKADANSAATARVVGVWAAPVSPNATGTLHRAGPLKNALSGATPGTPYFLQVGGGIGTTVPATGTGAKIVRIGFAINATDLDVEISSGSQRGL